jgi:hypothetical protein
VSTLGNYGSDDHPLCFDCSNKIKCADCKAVVEFKDQLKLNNEVLCPKCHKLRTGLFESDPKEPDFIGDIPQREKIDVLWPAKKLMDFGALGGVVLIIISATGLPFITHVGRLATLLWLFMGLGIVMLIKGLKDRNFWGERTKELHQKEMVLNEFKRE